MKARSTRMRYYYFDFRRLLVNLFLRSWQWAQKGAWRTGSGWRRRQGGGCDIIVVESKEQYKQWGSCRGSASEVWRLWQTYWLQRREDMAAAFTYSLSCTMIGRCCMWFWKSGSIPELSLSCQLNLLLLKVRSIAFFYYQTQYIIGRSNDNRASTEIITPTQMGMQKVSSNLLPLSLLP